MGLILRTLLRWALSNWLTFVLLALAVSMAIAAISLLDRGGSESHQYCTYIAYRRLEPVCVGKVTSVRGRALTFHIVRSSGLVTRIEALNGHGALINDASNIAARDYRYHPGSKIEMRLWDRIGVNYANVLEFIANGTRSLHRKPEGLIAIDAEVRAYLYDHRGFLVQEDIQTVEGGPMADDLNAFGYRYEYDDNGLATARIALSRDGEPTMTSEGWSRQTYRWTGDGRLVEQAAFDAGGKPITVRQGWASLRHEYDDVGNQLRTSYFDPAGKPAVFETGISTLVNTVDEHGDVIREDYLGPEGKPVIATGGCASTKYAYDDRGDAIEYTCLDERGYSRPDKHGISIVRKQYKARRVIQETYFDAAGKRADNQYGVSRVDRQFGERKEPIYEAFFDAGDRPTLGEDGYAAFQGRIGDEGWETERVFYGIDAKPTLIKGGYAGYRMELYANGKELALHYLDTHGAPTLSNDLYATVRYVRDARGNALVTEYFDTSGTRTMARWGYSRVGRQFDGAGNEIELSYFDVADQPIQSSKGCYRESRTYDTFGRVLERQCLDEAGFSMNDVDGVCRKVTEYDGRNVRSISYFGADGRPRRGPEDFAVQIAEYGAAQRPAKIRYFDEHGTFLRAEAFVYDARGKRLRQTRIGPDDRPVAGPEGCTSFASVYDARGDEVEETCLDANEAPAARQRDGLHRFVMVYDSRRRLTEERHFGLPPPAPPLKAPPLIRWRYDLTGRLLEISTFNLDGTPTKDDTGCASHEYRYNSRGLRIEDRCLDGHGNLTPRSTTGASVERYRYDDRGNQVAVEYSDGAGLINTRSGVAIRASTFDARGNELTRAYRDKDGNLAVPASEGYARMTASYNQILTDQAFFGADDSPINASGGFARAHVRIEPDGKSYLELYDQDGSWLVTMTTSTKRREYAPREVAVNTKHPIAPVLQHRIELTKARNQLEWLRTWRPEVLLGNRGLLVAEVVAKSQALRLGLLVGDILIEYGDTALDRYSDLIAAIGRNRGSSARLRLVRALKQIDITAQRGPLGVRIDQE